jgi:hypothetical protein
MDGRALAASCCVSRCWSTDGCSVPCCFCESACERWICKRARACMRRPRPFRVCSALLCLWWARCLLGALNIAFTSLTKIAVRASNF